MPKKRPPPQSGLPALRTNEFTALSQRIHDILEQARRQVLRSVNTEMVRAYWLIGREIVEEEQQGQARAGYGEALISQLAAELQARFGKGYTRSNLQYMRQFYLAFPALLDGEMGHDLAPPESALPIRHAVRGECAAPGRLNPNLSWTHYRLLVKVDSLHARSFYEVETGKNHWSSRELERQINSLLFERLANSRDKKGLLQLALKGQEIQSPQDAIKDPFVLEFVGLPESPRLVESDLEEALISNLQTFLLELGKGFAFVARQQRLTMEGDHFYVDLVFYHVILKCYVLLDLKVEKLTHADLGQMQLYVNYYDETQLTPGDNPTLGLLLCADKNDLMVKYTLGRGNKQIFASRYKLHLPTEKELAAEMQRELNHHTGQLLSRTPPPA
jgi:predicted nuclease of restriction endonuclease-like (RecB) superfamily